MGKTEEQKRKIEKLWRDYKEVMIEAGFISLNPFIHLSSGLVDIEKLAVYNKHKKKES